MCTPVASVVTGFVGSENKTKNKNLKSEHTDELSSSSISEQARSRQEATKQAGQVLCSVYDRMIGRAVS